MGCDRREEQDCARRQTKLVLSLCPVMFLAPLHRAPSDHRTLQAFLFDYYPDQDNSGNTQSPEQPTMSLENGAAVLYAKAPASGIDAHVCPQGSCLELNYAFNQYATVRWDRPPGALVCWIRWFAGFSV